jgi:hypothetical protein
LNCFLLKRGGLNFSLLGGTWYCTSPWLRAGKITLKNQVSLSKSACNCCLHPNRMTPKDSPPPPSPETCLQVKCDFIY